MRKKIKIEGIAVYHPSKIVTNDFYFQHFDKLGINVRHFYEKILGRKNRYEIDNTGKDISEHENSLTMQIKSAKQVLKNCNLEGKDIDGIILASLFPEYTAPPSSVIIHEAISGKERCQCFDLNANCTTMILAFQQAALMMEDDPLIRKMLIIGGDYLSITMPDDGANTYGTLGDSACAIIVSNDSEDCGIIDNDFYVYNTVSSLNKFPNCGLESVIKGTSNEIRVKESEGNFVDVDSICKKISEILERNSLDVSDIAVFCFSQFVKSNNEEIIERLNIPNEKCPYIGDEFGYTGANSPFLVLNWAVEHNKVKHGDYVFLWTIGMGMQYIFSLIKY